MATRPSRNLKIGDIIDKTIGVISISGVPVLIFLVIVAALSACIDLYSRSAITPGAVPSGATILQLLALTLLVMVVAFVGSYLMVETMLKRAGLMTYTGDRRILAFVGMSLLSLLGLIAGALMLILPFFIFMARWIVSAPLLIGRGDRITASLGNSWRMTKGHEFPIIVSLLLPLVVFNVLAYVPTWLFTEVPIPLVFIARIASTAGSVSTAAMGVAIYGMLKARDASGTFS